MNKLLIIILSAILASCGHIQINESKDESLELVTIKDISSTKQGYGVNVVAEIENRTNKKVTFVSVDFTWHDKNGRLITSQNGNTKNIYPNSTGFADSYFDEMPLGATYKAKIKEVIF